MHPFREGNGRLARLLALLMALQAGLPPLDFSPLTGRGKRAYIAGIHAQWVATMDRCRRCLRALSSGRGDAPLPIGSEGLGAGGRVRTLALGEGRTDAFDRG